MKLEFMKSLFFFKYQSQQAGHTANGHGSRNSLSCVARTPVVVLAQCGRNIFGALDKVQQAGIVMHFRFTIYENTVSFHIVRILAVRDDCENVNVADGVTNRCKMNFFI